MQSVVVAVDFSKGSLKALEYSANLASIIKAQLHVLWIEEALLSEMGIDKGKGLRTEAKQQLAALTQNLSKEYPQLPVQVKLRKGKVYQELFEEIKEHPSPILVIGAHGLSGFEEFWIGTNAMRVVAGVHCPVILIKAGYVVRKQFSKILMPIDHTPQTLHKAATVCAFAKDLKMDVNILALGSSLKSLDRVVENHVKKVVSRLSGQGVPYITDVLSGNYSIASVIDHALMVDADMVAIQYEGLGLANQQPDQMAMQMVSFCPLPVLCINKG